MKTKQVKSQDQKSYVSQSGKEEGEKQPFFSPQQNRANSFFSEPVQPKLKVSQPNDPAEKEADLSQKKETDSESYQIEQFNVNIDNGVQIPVPAEPSLIEQWRGNMQRKAKPETAFKFHGQALLHMASTLNDKNLLEIAQNENLSFSKAINNYKGSMNPTLDNVWMGAKESTVINLSIYATFRWQDGTYTQLTGEEIAVDLTWETGKSLMAESVASATTSAVTLYLSAQGGRIGMLAGPIGIAAGFTVGAAVGSSLDLMMTEQLQARLADFLSDENKHTKRRNIKLTKQRQKVIDNIIKRKSDLLDQIKVMESRFNAFQDVDFAIGSYEEEDSLRSVGINRGTSNRQVYKDVHQGLSALKTVKKEWSLTNDSYEILQDWNRAANQFEKVSQTWLPRAIEDAYELIKAADNGELVGPHAMPSGDKLMLRNGTVPKDPRPTLKKGIIFANNLKTLLSKYLEFFKTQSVDNPLSEQLDKTTGFRW